MLLAIQRAFVSALPWSPLSFALAITVSVIPDTSWSKALVPGLVTSFLLAGIGWSLDTIFKPRLTVKPVRSAPVGTWATILPLAVLLAVLLIGVVTLSALTQVRVVGIVAVLVPCIAVVWMLLQHWNENPVSTTCARIETYVLQELPSYRGELTLLMMAGFIGTAGVATFCSNDAGDRVRSVLPAFLDCSGLVGLDHPVGWTDWHETNPRRHADRAAYSDSHRSWSSADSDRCRNYIGMGVERREFALHGDDPSDRFIWRYKRNPRRIGMEWCLHADLWRCVVDLGHNICLSVLINPASRLNEEAGTSETKRQGSLTAPGSQLSLAASCTNDRFAKVSAVTF